MNVRTSVTESSGTDIGNCVNRSMYNDNEGHQGEIGAEETSDTSMSRNKMVCYTGRMNSDGDLSEVKEVEEHLLERVAIIEDTG